MYQPLSRRGGFVLGLLWLGFFSVACAQAPAQTSAQAAQPLFSRVGVISGLDLPARVLRSMTSAISCPLMYVFTSTTEPSKTHRLCVLTPA